MPVQEIFCPALAALVSPVQNIFFLTDITSLHLSPSSSKLGRQSCWVACQLINFSGGAHDSADVATKTSHNLNEVQVRRNLNFSVILYAKYSWLELYLAWIFGAGTPQTNENYAFRKPRTGCRGNMKYNVNAAHC
jgi:hypothetical protein